MEREYYAAPSTPTEDYLAHYGVKGMQWGVRKAIKKGNNRALVKQYAKASKKLAKLERRAVSGKKYAARAARLGAGAALAGTAAAVGTKGVSDAMRAVGKAGMAVSGKIHAAPAGIAAYKKLNASANALEKWGKGKTIGTKVGNAMIRNSLATVSDPNKMKAYTAVDNIVKKTSGKTINDIGWKAANASNNAYARLGAAADGAGLAGAAGYNAYRAATTKRAAKKADAFRREMNKAFAGTQFGGGQRLTSKKKRRR